MIMLTSIQISIIETNLYGIRMCYEREVNQLFVNRSSLEHAREYFSKDSHDRTRLGPSIVRSWLKHWGDITLRSLSNIIFACWSPVLLGEYGFLADNYSRDALRSRIALEYRFSLSDLQLLRNQYESKKPGHELISCSNLDYTLSLASKWSNADTSYRDSDAYPSPFELDNCEMCQSFAESMVVFLNEYLDLDSFLRIHGLQKLHGRDVTP